MAPPEKALRVLILDDVDSDGELTEQQFARSGLACAIRRVNDAAAYGPALREFRPDLVVSDYHISPTYTAMDALRQARADDPDLPFLVVTGAQSELVAAACIREGADDYLLKEDLNRLRIAVMNAIERRDGKRKAAAALSALQDSEARYRFLVDQVPAVVYSAALDGVGSTQFVSARIGEVAGFTVAEWLADPELWSKRLHPDDRERVLSDWSKAVQNGDFRAEYRLQRKDGTYAWVRDRATFVRASSGETRMQGIIEDVTQQRSLEEQFRHAQKMEAVGRLAGGIAHDFNNLITVIIGYCDLALKSLGAEHPVHPDVAEIKTASKRAAGLTRQLLSFSRRQILQPQVIEPDRLIAGVEAMLRRLLPAHVELHLKLSAAGLRVFADPGQLEQVLMNLAVNAMDAMSDGGKLIFETAAVELDAGYAQTHPEVSPGRYLRLSVSDTGIGMEPAVRTRIFEPFFTTKPSGKGTGLGLATVFGVVKQSGGHIAVYSEPGQGTVFKVYLPLYDGAAPAPAPLPGPVKGGHETVLVVEDEPTVRALAVRILSAAGYRLLEAGNGLEALRLCEGRSGCPDLVLTDLVMPGMGGTDFMAALGRRGLGTRVLYTSGYTDELLVRKQVMAAGMLFIQKPYAAQDLLRMVRTALDAPAISDSSPIGGG